MEVCQVEMNGYIRSDSEITKKKLPYIKDLELDENDTNTWTQKPIREEVIRPIEAEEVGNASVQGPFPCKVENPQTGLAWRPKGRRVCAVIGPEDGLHYWTITGSESGKRIFVFGHNLAGHWRYATVDLKRNKIIFKSDGVNPSLIDVDTDGTINDNRAFFMRDSNHSSGRHLVPALNEEMAVAISDKKKMLTLAARGPRAHPWSVIATD